MVSRLHFLKEQIEKSAQNIPPRVPKGDQISSPTMRFDHRPEISHAIIEKHYGPQAEKSVSNQTPTKNNIMEMQNSILDLERAISQLGEKNFPVIGKNNVPDGGWGLKTNQALQFISDYMNALFPFLKELKKENLLMEDPNSNAMEWFKENVPKVVKNTVPLTPQEKNDRAGEFVKALKYMTILLHQYFSLAQKGEYRNLINGSQTIAHYPGKRQLLKAPGETDTEDQIGVAVNSILNSDPNTVVPIKFPGGSGIPLKALTSPEQYFTFMEQKNIDQPKAKEILSNTIKPAVQSFKV